jgi:hypothetical protein
LLLSGTRLDRQFRWPIQVDQQNCLLVGDTSAPVAELRDAAANEHTPFAFRGPNNFYPRSMVFYRHAFRQDGELQRKDQGFGSLPSWASSLNTFPGELAAAPPETPTHDHLPGDYVLKSPADTNAGCNPSQLPVVDSTVRRPIMGASTMGTMKPDPTMSTPGDEKTSRPTP